MGLRSCIAAVVILVTACATPVTTMQTPSIERWDGRTIDDLIATIGPFDATAIRGDARTYDWYRFGNCRLVAHTAPDGKIIKIDMEGTSRGCDSYLQKLGG